MRLEAEYWDQAGAGVRVRKAIIMDYRPFGSRAEPRALIGARCYNATQLDGAFVTRSRDIRAIERLRRHGFTIHGPEFLSRTPYPGSAERDPDGSGAAWW